jgi:hypothetical protein
MVDGLAVRETNSRHFVLAYDEFDEYVIENFIYHRDTQ